MAPGIFELTTQIPKMLLVGRAGLSVQMAVHVPM